MKLEVLNAASGQIKLSLTATQTSNLKFGKWLYDVELTDQRGSVVTITGDGSGAECTVTVNADQQVGSVVVTNQGSGYTFGTVDIVAGGLPRPDSYPQLDVIVPPQGGHGKDIYKELGASNLSKQFSWILPDKACAKELL